MRSFKLLQLVYRTRTEFNWPALGIIIKLINQVYYMVDSDAGDNIQVLNTQLCYTVPSYPQFIINLIFNNWSISYFQVS